MRTVVYTAITGAKDALKPPEILDRNVDYICFTDNPAAFPKPGCWKIKPLRPEKDKVRLARKVKILAHRFVGEYDRSIWIDGKVRPRRRLLELVDRYVPPNRFLIWQHYQRNCLYDELKACRKLRKDDVGTMTKQVEKYRREGYPRNNGMVRSEVIFRMHNQPDVIKAMEFWCHEVLTKSRRDQLSFNYMTWRLKFRFLLLRDQSLYNRHFSVYKHSR